jgi:phosphonate transport system substrate-binding protein
MLETTGGDSLTAPEEILRFAYANVLSPERSTVAYAELAGYLTAKLGRPVEILRRRTYAELNSLLQNGTAHAGIVCTGAFAVAQEEFGLEVLVLPVVDGQITYRSYVIARRGAGRDSFEDLRNVVFAFSDPLSNTGYRYVAAKLRDRGTDASAFFSRHFFTYSHDNAIQAVLDGIADAGSVDALVWDHLVRLDPVVEAQLVIVDRSEEFPINPVVVSPDISSNLRRALKTALLEMADDPHGVAVLNDLGTERFLEPTAATFAGYAAIARSWRELGVLGPEARVERH